MPKQALRHANGAAFVTPVLLRTRPSCFPFPGLRGARRLSDFQAAGGSQYATRGGVRVGVLFEHFPVFTPPRDPSQSGPQFEPSPRLSRPDALVISALHHHVCRSQGQEVFPARISDTRPSFLGDFLRLLFCAFFSVPRIIGPRHCWPTSSIPSFWCFRFDGLLCSVVSCIVLGTLSVQRFQCGFALSVLASPAAFFTVGSTINE